MNYGGVPAFNLHSAGLAHKTHSGYTMMTQLPLKCPPSLPSPIPASKGYLPFDKHLGKRTKSLSFDMSNYHVHIQSTYDSWTQIKSWYHSQSIQHKAYLRNPLIWPQMDKTLMGIKKNVTKLHSCSTDSSNDFRNTFHMFGNLGKVHLLGLYLLLYSHLPATGNCQRESCRIQGKKSTVSY